MWKTNDRRKSSDSSRDSACFYNGEISQHGYLIKSPPQSRFSNQSSWKKRYFVLVKTNKNDYALQYYKCQMQKNQHRGSIAIDKITELRLGIANLNILVHVQRMFNCLPELVISLKTEKREYFLIGEQITQVEEWFSAIDSAWRESGVGKQPVDARIPSISQTQCLWSVNPIISKPSPSDKTKPDTVDPRVRCSSDTVSSMVSPADKIEMSQSSSRPYSDPFSNSVNGQPQSTSTMLPLQEGGQHKLTQEQKYEEKCSSDEGIYDYPNSRPVHQPDRACEEPADHRTSFDSAISAISDEESSDEDNTYEKMSSIALYNEPDQNTQCETSDCSPACSPDINEKRSSLSRGVRTSESFQEIRRNRWRQRSTPTQVKLGKFFILKDPKKFTEVDIYVPTEDASKNLELLEVGERICVSRWSGPEDIRCQFHYGDHILAVNGIETKDKEEVIQFIQKARDQKVKVTVYRVEDSEVLHTEGCTCP